MYFERFVIVTQSPAEAALTFRFGPLGVTLVTLDKFEFVDKKFNNQNIQKEEYGERKIMVGDPDDDD